MLHFGVGQAVSGGETQRLAVTSTMFNPEMKRLLVIIVDGESSCAFGTRPRVVGPPIVKGRRSHRDYDPEGGADRLVLCGLAGRS